MSGNITVSGLGSGLDYQSWIKQLVAIKQADIDAVSAQVTTTQRKEKALSTVESDYKNLLKSIQTFTDALSSNSVFNQKTVTSSSDSVTASVNSKANLQDLSISVSELATATKAESTYTVASTVDENTKLSSIADGSLETGNFTIYVDGKANSISVDENTTLKDILDTIGRADGQGIDGVSAGLSNGKLTISADSGHTITVGSTSDTSNFSNIMSLTRNSSTKDYSSSKTIFDTSVDSSITSTHFVDSNGSDASVTAGTFYINDVEFTIDDSTSLNDIVDKINNSNAGVAAAWDSNKGTLQLTSEEEGSINIDIEAGTSNFTDIMGLTKDGGLITGSQALGTNAVLTINGTTITSSSNTVTSDISGISGLTLTLNTTTSSDAKVEISQDTSKATSAITSFVNAFNTAIADTDSATATDGNLYGESILNSVRNKIRNLVTSSIGSGVYKTLTSIGISTGAIGTSTNANTNQLVIDTNKLNAALTTNPDAVKSLLVGDKTSGTTGLLNKLETTLNNATDATKGYFTTRDASYEKDISRLNEKVTKMNKSLTDYQKQLETKFSAMDKLISSLQNSASVFDSYFNKKNNSSNSSSSG